jgi:hypothetical protein
VADTQADPMCTGYPQPIGRAGNGPPTADDDQRTNEAATVRP